MENFLDQLWSGDAIGDGAVGVYLLAAGGVAVYKAREAVVPHDADPSVCTSELPDHALRDLGRTVDDVVLADRVHADFGPRAFGCINEPYIFRWGQGARSSVLFFPCWLAIVASTGSYTVLAPE